MTITQLLERVRANKTVEFGDTMAAIESGYHYTPGAFSNGLGADRLENAAGQNAGSCKVFAFAQIHRLDQEQTLQLFGSFYRNDVEKHPEGTDHGNIRTFMRYGWSGIQFDGEVLRARSATL